jgi:hypothetical protein
MQVTCIKCGDTGILTKKLTVSKGIKYEYWYVQHVTFNKGKRKTKWCYLGKFGSLPEEYRELIHKYTQTNLVTTQRTNNLKLSSIQQKSLVTPFLLVSQANTRQQCMSTRTG